MSAISFTKATACGNTFLLIDSISGNIDSKSHNTPQHDADLSVLSRRLCDPHFGVGADGVEWLFPDPEADVLARLFNADGSEAEISGNGTRCVAAEICFRLHSDVSKREVVIRTGAGIKMCRLTGHRDNTFEFETDMGVPQIGGELSIETMWVKAAGIQLSMGNPHYVIFVGNFRDGWQKEASLIGSQPQFQQGTNVEYAAVRGPNEIAIRHFERGVGETQSSGTGSCAAAVAAIATNRVSSPVTVIAPGGSQTVRWEDRVYLKGPATIICKGEFFI